MISFEEFKIELELRMIRKIPSPCYICKTSHTLRYLCSVCWGEHKVNTRCSITDLVTTGESVYKIIQDILTEQIAAQIEQELLR